MLDSYSGPRYRRHMSSGVAPSVRIGLRCYLDRLRGRDIGIRFVTVGGDRLFVDSPDRYAAALAWKLGWRDGAARRLIGREVGPGMVAVDVGANIGWYTLALARRVGAGGRVVALEPEARCFELLRRAVGGGRCSQVEPRQIAAGDYSGWTTLYVSDTDQGDHRVIPAPEERRQQTVRAVNLDDLLADAPRIEFVKLAVQGAEVAVLRGMRRTLACHPDLRLLCAVSPALLERAGAAADALFEPLRDAGLVPHHLRHNGTAEPIHPAAAWSLARVTGSAMLYFRRAP
jgi:FkbM family methyltransferase